MDERGIIIADRDAAFRKEMAQHFRKAGYQVETTDSAVHVLCNILEKQTPVLLLGSDFDKKVSSADLIHLLKKCNRHLSVIMVSEGMPLAQARQVRQEGIFYEAMKPATPAENEELGLAVACAFKKHGSKRHHRRLQATLREPATQQYRPQRAGTVQPPKHAVSWLIGLAVLVFGISYLALVAAESALQGRNAGIWLFLSFCALLIATQLLPVFRINLPLHARHQEPVKQQEAPVDEKTL